MRLPRDISGSDLIKRLEVFGYVPTRQVGSHVRLSTESGGQHHLTIPLHQQLRVGTLNSIVSDLMKHFSLTKNEVLKRLFG